MRMLQRIWDDVKRGENIDLYVTVIVAFTLSLLSLVGLASDSLITATVLAVLGILAVSTLSNRHRLESIKDSTSRALEAVLTRFGERPPAEQFFMDYMPPLEPHLRKAKDVRMSGVVLQRTIRDNLNVLAACLREGGCIRVILVNPESDAARRIADEHFSLERLKSHFDATWQNLLWLSKQPGLSGTLEVRLSDEEPFWNIIAIDPDKEYGIIFVEIRPQHWISGGFRPRFELRPGRDGHWFDYFKDQFDRMWNNCRHVGLS